MLHSITSAKKIFFTIKPSHSAIMLAFCALSASIAQANCTPLNSASVTCINSDPSTLITSYTGNSTITATNWTLNSGYFQGRDPGTNGTVTFIGDGITVNNGGGATYGAIHLSASTSSSTGGNTSLIIKNSTINSTFASGHGLASHANNATGSAELTLINTNVNMAASTTTGYGLVVNAIGSGNATLRMSGGGVTTANSAGTGGTDKSYAITAHSGSGNVDARLSGGTITTTGANAQGINAVVDSGTGTVFVDNGNTISTGGVGAYGIYASSASGDSNVINSGAITTGNSNAHGIYAKMTGTGNASITNSNNVTINGPSTALRIDTTTSNAIINQNAGDITINGAVSNGAIYAGTNGAGSATVNMNGGTLTNNSTDASGHGLEAKANGTGDATVNLSAGSVSTKGGLGIAAWTGTTGTGNAKVTTEAGTTINASGTGNPGGIYARGGSAAGTSVSIDSKSDITAGTIGIQARSLNGGNITITQTGGSITSGAAGIDAKSDGNISITNFSNLINTQNTGARGIYIENTSGANINIKSSGQISTQGSSIAGGIFANTTNSHINSDISGNITTVGTFSPAIEMISQRNTEGTASNLLYYHDGVAKVGAGSNAISLWDGGVAIGSGEVHIGANTTVDASHGLSAVQNLLAEDSLINIDAGAYIIGGTGSGIALGGLRGTLNTSGTVGSMNDLAIENGSYPVNSQIIALNNQSTGNITGYIKLGSGQNTLTNNGLWNLRNFADTDGDQIRDTLSIAASDFGNGGNNSITNSGTIALLGDDGVASTLNNSGEYATGYAANTMALGGAVQGQILGVKTFTNSGIIDMGGANNAVGDVLIISGGNAAGTSGGGVYMADGGLLKLDTVLNQGGINSQSDMLIVDTTRLGSSATAINIKNVGGYGAMTVDNGIELVRVLESTQSAAGTFKLDGRLVTGIYEYDLYQGDVANNANDGNWYLRTLALPNPPNPEPRPAPRPETGVYLRNLSAASTMFIHTLHDRLGEPQFTDAYKADNTPSAWVRVVANKSKSQAANGQIDLSTDTALVHFGGDLARWSNNDNDRWLFGLMGAYGKSDTDADPVQLKQTNSGYKRTANGSVEGYSAGGYATWYGNIDKPTGPYIDTWAQYGWYNNKVQGNILAEERYHSRGWTASVEGGYAFVVYDNNEKRQWLLEPQAQVAYNSYNANDHQEANGTRVYNSQADGVITRVGARLYSHSKLNDNGIQPFIEANWWYGDAKNSIDFNGVQLSNDTPNSRYELKAGLQGEVAKNWQMWGHIGGQWGENSYSRYEGMIGLKRMF